MFDLIPFKQANAVNWPVQAQYYTSLKTVQKPSVASISGIISLSARYSSYLRRSHHCLVDCEIFSVLVLNSNPFRFLAVQREQLGAGCKWTNASTQAIN